MRVLRLTFLLALLIAWPARAPAQVIGTQIITVVSSGGACSVDQSCASFSVGAASSVTIQVSGTWTGTLTFESTSDGITWATVTMIKLADNSEVTTTTGNGQFSFSNTGVLGLRARATATITGSATVVATRGSSVASRAGGGGAGAAASANTVWAGPSTGSPAVATFRALVTADIPTILASKTLTLPLIFDAVAAKTGNYTVSATDGLVTCDSTAGTVTLTLPAISGITGRYYSFKKIDTSSNNCTLDGNASETIDGATTYSMNVQYASAVIKATAAGWVVEAQNFPSTSTTMSALLDATIGSAQGDLAMRNATVWTALAPGTAGLPLVSAGASADLAYGVLGISGGGSAKALTLAAGGLLWTDADSFEVGAAGTSGRAAISGGTGAPTWFAPTVGSVLFAGASGILQQDNASLFFDDTNNYLGLGIAVPLARLHVSQGVSGYSAFTNVIGTSITPQGIITASVDETSFAGASTTFAGTQFEISANPASNATRSVIGTQSSVRIPSSNAVALSGYTLQSAAQRAQYDGTSSILTVRGAQGTAVNSGTGTVTTLNALAGTATNSSTGTATTATGFVALSQNTGGGLITNAYGLTATGLNSGTNTVSTMIGADLLASKTGTGTVTTMYGARATLTISNATGTTTDAMGFRVEDLTNAATITNTYGLYVGDITTGTQTNLPFSLYTADFVARNYLRSVKSSFAFQSDTTGGYVNLTTATVSGGHGSDKHQTTIQIAGATDSSTDYFNPVIQMYAHNNDASTADKYLGDVWGCEGTYTDAGALGATSHCYLWDGINSRTMLEFPLSTDPRSPLRALDTGLDIESIADKAIVGTTVTPLVTNTATTTTYYGLQIRPTFNTGGSNSNKTVNVLDIDTVNTAVTGVTTNLAKLSYGASQKFLVDSSGNVTAAGSITATLLFISGGSAPAVSNTSANSCGTSAATITGTDGTGVITVGATAGSSCTLTFVNAAPNRRQCWANNETTGNLTRYTYTDTTHGVIAGTFVAADKVSYGCLVY